MQLKFSETCKSRKAGICKASDYQAGIKSAENAVMRKTASLNFRTPDSPFLWGEMRKTLRLISALRILRSYGDEMRKTASLKMRKNASLNFRTPDSPLLWG